ncbi:MAG TPA: zinc ribbon domain-containing protein [Candidatus Limnocylindrales bacterium]|nr:zinc ribbon domain-containing protein [Candidatus Limnocylindrales bacterium]
MNDDTAGELVACPRCGTPTRPGDRFCANCGLRLPRTAASRSAPASRAGSFLVFLGPAIGGVLGFIIAEAIVGQLSSDGSVVFPIALIVAIGTIVGGPVLMWLIDRLQLGR